MYKCQFMKYILFIIILLLTLNLNGQEKEGAVLFLENNSYDFGRVREDNGTVSYTFTFSNTGNLPLVLNNVRSTCGCTTPKWSREPIPPGERGYLTVEFDPKNRLGSFYKTIQLQSTAINSNMFVTLTGNILPPVKEEKLMYTIGSLSVKSKHINFGYLFKGKTGIQTLTIANHTDSMMHIGFQDVPEHMVVHLYPSILQPGEYGQIEIHYNTNLIDDWDVVIERLSVLINGKEVQKDKFAVTANIREDFSGLTNEEFMNAPIACFDIKEHTFDTITIDKPVKCSFKLKNNGESDLIIRALKPSCGCTLAKQKRKILPPGASTKIEAVFDPKGKSGSFKNSITIITNDPRSYKQYLIAGGYIKR